MFQLQWSSFAFALALGICGFTLLAINSWQSPSARRRGSQTHWARGWLVNGLGMTSIGVAWLLLGAMGPRMESSFLLWLGVPAGLLGGSLYVLGAKRVGRLKAPSRYSLELDTSGLYSMVRHPQALALILLAVSLALLTRSFPLLLSLPVWVVGWLGYTYLEEELELVPTFGEQYMRYRRRTPRLWPRLDAAREASRRILLPAWLRPRQARRRTRVGSEVELP